MYGGTSVPPYIPTYTNISVHTFIHTFKNTSIQPFIHTFTNMSIHQFIHKHVHTFIHTFTNTSIHPCMHTFINTSVHPFIHTFSNAIVHSYSRPVCRRTSLWTGRTLKTVRTEAGEVDDGDERDPAELRPLNARPLAVGSPPLISCAFMVKFRKSNCSPQDKQPGTRREGEQCSLMTYEGSQGAHAHTPTATTLRKSDTNVSKMFYKVPKSLISNHPLDSFHSSIQLFSSRFLSLFFSILSSLYL